jgi:hypothetical protein
MICGHVFRQAVPSYRATGTSSPSEVMYATMSGACVCPITAAAAVALTRAPRMMRTARVIRFPPSRSLGNGMATRRQRHTRAYSHPSVPSPLVRRLENFGRRANNRAENDSRLAVFYGVANWIVCHAADAYNPKHSRRLG